MYNGSEHNSCVLLVDDEQAILDTYSLILRAAGIDQARTCQDSRDVLPFLAEFGAAAIVLDVLMPHLSGPELLLTLKKDYPYIPVIMMTSSNDVETAINCMKYGASDYLTKPVEKSRFVAVIKRTLDMKELSLEASALRHSLICRDLRHPEAFSSIVTGSEKMQSVFRYIEAIGMSKQPVLITGETGVGKELMAQAIHRICGRKGELVAVNVAGLDDSMFSDALFGHERGAFTSAEKQRGGLIQQAAGGTLFLDEVGDMQEASQVKLLRLLQENIYYPLGSDMPKKSDARIVVATNKDLHSCMHEGVFRKDLYYRLNTHHVHMPPLRERPEDIPLLTDYFLAEAAASMNRKKPATTPGLLPLLGLYHFPGNVRELQGMCYDAVARHKSGVLSMESFREVIQHNAPSLDLTVMSCFGAQPAVTCSFSHFPTKKEIDDFFMQKALELSMGNVSMAASLLGITRQAIHKKLNKHTKRSEA
ncbi:MAG: sigma-54-dependent Fis family transcriptional regulator [Nitrospirae bacterium]|nr:sigma-54-dependent Fis family transcriptional regulator [Nitrospirota bacterium]